MKNTTKKTQLEILNAIYDQDLKASDSQKSKWFQTDGFGKIEVWNYIECNRQNAESDGNDFEGHIRSCLSDEWDSPIGKFFTRKGFII
jgi:hypothetical protein